MLVASSRNRQRITNEHCGIFKTKLCGSQRLVIMSDYLNSTELLHGRLSRTRGCWAFASAIIVHKTHSSVLFEKLGHNTNCHSTKGLEETVQIDRLIQMHFLRGAIGLPNVGQIEHSTWIRMQRARNKLDHLRPLKPH